MAMGNDPVNEVDPNGGWAGLSPDAMTYLSNAVSYWNSYHLDEVVVTPQTDIVDDILAFSYGFVNAYNSNQTCGVMERDVREAEVNENVARGALAADILSLARSIIEIEAGAVAAGGGGTLSLSGVGATVGVPIAAGGVALALHGGLTGAYTMGQLNDSMGRVHFAKKKTSSSGKEKANDIPSWVNGRKPNKGESGKSYAKRLLDEKYGAGNWKDGAGSEFNQIRKYGDRFDK